MTKSKSYLALIGAVFAALATIAAASARKCCQNVLAAMHRSREQEAARVIAHYRHLWDERPSKQQKNLSKNYNAPDSGLKADIQLCPFGVKKRT
jgi:hypothetical protein